MTGRGGDVPAAGASSGTGSALDNVLTGGTRSDMLSGAAGNDTIVGGKGDKDEE